MKKALKIIIPLVIVLLIAGYIVYYRYSRRTIFNDSFVNGNTAGNLYNDGLFCEHNGIIYFSNPSDGYRLYSMTVDGTSVTKLCDDIATYINADDNYVYYVRNNLGANSDYFYLQFNTNSLCRLAIKNQKITILDSEPSMYASLIGNYIYYIHYDTTHGSTFNRVKIDGTEKEILNKNPYFTCSTNGQYLYYNGLENDHNIYQLDTSSGSSHIIFEGNCWMPIVNNEQAFYMDAGNNFTLNTLGLSNAAASVLVDQRVDFFNVYGRYIYFQTSGEDAALCRIDTDGSHLQVIRPGNHSKINITSRYVYFREYGNDTIVYQTPVGGDGAVSIFHP